MRAPAPGLGWRRFIPISVWLTSYERGCLLPDVIAALTGWALMVPEAMAYASIAGMPPETGLYAALVAPLAYAIFGTSRQLNVGPSSTVAVLSFSIVGGLAVGNDPATFYSLTAALAILTGAFFVIAGLARLGFLADFMSRPVLDGFIVGLALTIAAGQLHKLFGIHETGENFFGDLAAVITNLGETVVPTLVIGAASLAGLFALERVMPRIPAALVVAGLAIIVTAGLNLEEQGVAVIGHIPAGLPSLAWPDLGLGQWFSLVPGALAFLVLAWRQAGIGSRHVVRGFAALGGAGAVIALHSFYKLGFAIEGYTRFMNYGLAERTGWEALLVAAAFALTQVQGRFGAARAAAIAMLGAALAHFGWFTLLWHNPLWNAQAVGPVWLANLALAAYAVAVAALAVLKPLGNAAWRRAADIAIMALLPVLAITLLRQAFSGSILTTVPMGQGEDLLRSLAGIVLAIGYLLWGARAEDRTWRIGSLVLMILAVGKVFIVDAAVLDGLARIGSFLALGFSLIGIGWFYSRILSRPKSEGATPQPSAG